MAKIVILGVIAWWVAEGSFLVQTAKWYLKFNRLWILDCPKCLGFWLGLVYDFNISFEHLAQAILVSAVAIFISKIYKV